LPLATTLEPRVGESISSIERLSAASALHDEPAGHDHHVVERARLKLLVARLGDRVGAGDDVAGELIAGLDTVVFRVDEPGREESLERRGVTFHDSFCPRLLEIEDRALVRR